MKKMEEMDIAHPDFLEQQFEIVHSYSELGIDAILSCTPYDRGIEEEKGIGLGRVKCGLLLKFIHVSGDKQGVRSLSIGDCID